MSNSYYNHTTYPTPNSPGSSAQLRAELENITAGFALLPTLAANSYKVAMINSAGTAMSASSALQSLSITSSTINSTAIGATTAAAGTFTSLTVTGTASLGSTTVITGGTINGTPIGGTTPSTAAFTTVSASSGFTGPLAGNVTGNLTGNVTGNVAGNLTGNVASSGTSTFAAITMSGAIAMGTSKITGLGDPTSAQDAATKTYVDTADSLKLNLTGGTMSGAIAMGTSKITGVGNPTLAQDVATKTYVDTADALKLNLTGGTMSGAIAMGTSKITGVGDPTAAQDVATKYYVDNLSQGLDAKASCRVATTANITLSGAQTIDGVAIVAGDRVLVKDQSAPANNGIYLCAASTWTRTTDADTWAELPAAFVFVEVGTLNANNGYVCTIADGGTLGTTAITWVQFSGAGQITAGAGLTKTGNTLDVGTASSSRIVVNADNIDLATTAVTAGTYQSLTVDAYGRITAGINPTTLAGYNISNAYTTTQVDTALALKLNLTGGTMSGAIAMGTSKITGLGNPTVAQDAATKTYVDTADALKLNLAGGTMSGAIAMGASKITGLADPTLAQDATTKFYVDGILGSATAASTSAAAAAVSATNASNSATAAATSATASATSATNALSSLNTFRGQYYGALSTDPTLDPLGNAMTSGDLYFNTTIGYMKVFDGVNWLIAYLPASGYLALGGGTMTGTISFAGGQTWPTFNQNTTGTAAGLSSTLAVASGGTGVTSSTGTGSVVLSTSPSLVTPLLGTPTSGNFSIGTFTWPTFNQNTTGTASNVTGTIAVVNGGTGSTSAGAARTALGATTLGANLFTIANPSAITFPRYNADNTVSSLDGASFRTAIGAGTGNGSVTSITVSAGTGMSGGGTVSTSGTVTLTNAGVTSIVAGSNITVSGSTGAVTINASGGGIYAAKTSAYTAVSGDSILADTSGGSFTITLPASPTTGQSIQILDSKGTFQLYPLTISRNGKNIMGLSEDLIAGTATAGFGLVYNGTEWRII